MLDMNGKVITIGALIRYWYLGCVFQMSVVEIDTVLNKVVTRTPSNLGKLLHSPDKVMVVD